MLHDKAIKTLSVLRDFLYSSLYFIYKKLIA